MQPGTEFINCNITYQYYHWSVLIKELTRGLNWLWPMQKCMHAHTHTACSMLGKLRKKEKKLPPHSYKLGQINNCDWNRQDETWQNCTVLYYSVYCCSFTVLSHTALMPGKALMMILFTGQRDKPIREIWLFPAWMNKRGRGREGGSWRYPRACDLTLSGLMVELILRLNSYVTRLTWPDS